MDGKESHKEKTTKKEILDLGILSIFLVVSMILTSYYGPIFRELIKEKIWSLIFILGVMLALFVFFLLLTARYIIKGFSESTNQNMQEEDKSSKEGIEENGESDEKIYYDLAKSRLDSTFREVDSIRAFVSILITADSIGAVLIGIIARNVLSSYQFLFLIIALGLILTSLPFLFCVLRKTNKYKTRSSKKIENAYQSKKLNEEIAGEELLAIAEYNEVLIDKITSKLSIANFTTFGGLILLIIMVLTLI